MSSWIDALKKWNAAKGGKWVVPRKGTAEYEAVKEIMADDYVGQMELDERKKARAAARRAAKKKVLM